MPLTVVGPISKPAAMRVPAESKTRSLHEVSTPSGQLCRGALVYVSSDHIRRVASLCAVATLPLPG